MQHSTSMLLLREVSRLQFHCELPTWCKTPSALVVQQPPATSGSCLLESREASIRLRVQSKQRQVFLPKRQQPIPPILLLLRPDQLTLQMPGQAQQILGIGNVYLVWHESKFRRTPMF